MYFYFEGMDQSGDERRGVVEASSREAAEFIILADNMTPSELRPATADEIRSEGYGKSVAVCDAHPGPVSLLPLTNGRVRLIGPDGEHRGQLSFCLTGDVQRLIFSDPAESIEEVGERWLDVPVPELERVERFGFLTKRLEITTQDGRHYVISGDVSQAHLLIRFAMAEYKSQG